MKYRLFLAAIIVILAVLVTLWWSKKPAEVPEPKLTATAASPARTAPAPAASPAVPPPTRVALPAQPTVVKSATPPALVTSSSPSPADAAANAASLTPPTELITAISDISRLLHNGNYMDFVLKYTPPHELAAMTPEELDQRQQMDHNPQNQPMFEVVGRLLDSLSTQTPTFNAAGDQAVYMAEQLGPDPQNIGPQPIIFVKVDGRWYKEPTVMTIVDGQWYLAKRNPPR